MSVLHVSNDAQFNSAIASAHAGDTINMAAGDYGDVVIKAKNFAQDITITSADPTHAAILHSLSVTESSGIDFKGIDVIMTPTASTLSFSAAVKFSNSSNISFVGGAVTGGKAITGVAATETKLDGTGNVIGMDTGHGIDVSQSSHILIQNVEISHLMKGIGTSYGSDITIQGNYIHDVRTSTIVAAGVNGLTIDSNKMSDSHPWSPNKDGSGDHADFIHIWTDLKHQTAATHDITITNNVLEQGSGVAPLGIYLDDNANKLGFTNVKIEGNVILNGVGQGIRLENVSNSVVDNNTLLQTSGTVKNAPGITINDGSHDVDVSHNLASYVLNATTGVAAHASIHDNTIVQAHDANLAGYYAPYVLGYVEQLASTVGASQYVLQNLGHAEPVSQLGDFGPMAFTFDAGFFNLGGFVL
jgi:parallel beta-helix repeat protein